MFPVICCANSVTEARIANHSQPRLLTDVIPTFLSTVYSVTFAHTSARLPPKVMAMCETIKPQSARIIRASRSGVNNRKELARRETHESAAPAFGVVLEIDQRVAIVDLDVKKAQRCKPQEPGNLGAEAVADRRNIEGS